MLISSSTYTEFWYTLVLKLVAIIEKTLLFCIQNMINIIKINCSCILKDGVSFITKNFSFLSCFSLSSLFSLMKLWQNYLANFVTPGFSPAGPWLPCSNLFSSHTRYLSHCGTLIAKRYALHTLNTGSITSPFNVSANLSSISWDDKCDKLSPLLWPSCSTSCNKFTVIIIIIIIWYYIV